MEIACISFLHSLHTVTYRTAFTVQHRINFSYETVAAILADKHCAPVLRERFIILPAHQFVPIKITCHKL